jgi:hypothetical protein
MLPKPKVPYELVISPLPFDVTPVSTTETQVMMLPAGSVGTVIVDVEVLIVPAATDTPPVEV